MATKLGARWYGVVEYNQTNTHKRYIWFVAYGDMKIVRKLAKEITQRKNNNPFRDKSITVPATDSSKNIVGKWQELSELERIL